MNRMVARLIAGLISDREKRHEVRRILLDEPDSPTLRLGKLVKEVPSLHDYVRMYGKIGEILEVLTPQQVPDAPLVRMGGQGDGGYVMLDPGRDGIAYSFGVSSHSPWDLEMAERGFTVYQFDGTIPDNPDKHPNLIFRRANILAPSKMRPDAACIGGIIAELGHEDRDGIVLQMDIEGGEWDVLEEMNEKEAGAFSQMVLELHDLVPGDAHLDRNLEILRKLSRTHTPIHVHLNNCITDSFAKRGLFFYSSAFEVTWVRTGDHRLEKSGEFFPTSLDSPNAPQLPDIAIGKWE